MKKGLVGKLIALLCIPVLLCCHICIAAEHDGEDKTYIEMYGEEELYFEGDENEQEEFLHFLLAKLVYDDIDGFEGKSVRDYIDANPYLYDKEIWTDSGITYNNLYNRFVGDFKIYKVYNNNSDSGFYAVAFFSDNHAILAFRGSEMFTDSFALNESNDWTGTDFKFALLNKLSMQFDDSVSAYEDFSEYINNEGKEVDITFTGHSLGGALVANASIITGCYGYSFDGACGHVIDLIYYYSVLDIDGFTGVEKQPFCNYTDDTGYFVADAIQHTNAYTMYQIDRETELENMSENTAIPKYSTGASHIIWSTLGHEGGRLYFTDKCVRKGEMYTYKPEGCITVDITKNIIQAGAESFTNFILPGSFGADDFKLDKENILAASLGAIKDGRVMLASEKGSVMRAYDDIGVNSSFAVSAIMYGGAGNDKLYGYTSDDVLIAGGGSNILDGGLGKDAYIIDKYDGALSHIYDAGDEESYIIFRNFDIKDIGGLTLTGGNEIRFEGGQIIKLQMKQKADNIKLFAYDKGELIYLGDMSQLGYKGNDIKAYNRIIMLEGKARISLTDETGNDIMLIVNDINATRTVEGKLFKAYVCGEKGNESILLLMDDSLNARVSSEKKIDAAFGRIDNEMTEYGEENKIICGKSYKTKFENYSVDFYNEEIMNQTEGEIGREDAIDAGISYFIDLLFKGKL